MTKRCIQQSDTSSVLSPDPATDPGPTDEAVRAWALEKATYPNPEGQLSETVRHTSWKFCLTYLLQSMFETRQDEVLMLTDTNWYPLMGNNTICCAPDLMVVFGRPMQMYMGSYQQWRQDGISPQCLIEIKTTFNNGPSLEERLAFYEQYGARECIVIDPVSRNFQCYSRPESGSLTKLALLPNGSWLSPYLDLRFQLEDGKLQKILTQKRRILARAEEADHWSRTLHERLSKVTRATERACRARPATGAKTARARQVRLAADAKTKEYRRARLAAEAKAEEHRLVKEQ